MVKDNEETPLLSDELEQGFFSKWKAAARNFSFWRANEIKPTSSVLPERSDTEPDNGPCNSPSP